MDHEIQSDRLGWLDHWLSAWTLKRLDTLLDWYADDCAYVDPLCPSGLIGKKALAAHLDAVFDDHPDWRFLRLGSHRTHGIVEVEWVVLLSPPCEGQRRYGQARLSLRNGQILEQNNRYALKQT